MDVLSQVLREVKFSGAILFRAELSSPWAISAPPIDDLAPLLLPGGSRGRVILFHVALRGGCWVVQAGREPFELRAGDIAVVCAGAHTLCDEPNRSPVPVTTILPRTTSAAPPEIRHGGGGAEASLSCGYFQFDHATFNPLLAALPDVLCVRDADHTAGQWLRATLEHFVREAASTHAGRDALRVKLAELLFIEVVRHHMQCLTAGEQSWLAALNDPVVGRALELIHGAPEQAWTVRSLAKLVGVSRSALATRFSRQLGEPPMHYLARWRMQLASTLLRKSRRGMASVAAQVGYESEPAFNRAFKRHVGEAPAKWLRSQQA